MFLENSLFINLVNFDRIRDRGIDQQTNQTDLIKIRELKNTIIQLVSTYSMYVANVKINIALSQLLENMIYLSEAQTNLEIKFFVSFNH